MKKYSALKLTIYETWAGTPASGIPMSGDFSSNFQDQQNENANELCRKLIDGYEIVSAQPFSNGQGSCGVQYVLTREFGLTVSGKKMGR